MGNLGGKRGGGGAEGKAEMLKAEMLKLKQAKAEKLTLKQAKAEILKY